MLVDNRPLPRLLKEISFGERLAVPRDEDEIIRQDAIHGGSVNLFNRRLVLGVERSNGFLIIVSGRVHTIYTNGQQDDSYPYSQKCLHFLSLLVEFMQDSATSYGL